MDSKAIELCQDHYIHQEAAYNHESEFGLFMLHEKSIKSLGYVENLILYASDTLWD